MVKKKDLLKIFFIYICLCHVTPAHPCGDNPLRNLIYISERTGRSLHSVLSVLRTIDNSAYKRLRMLFHNYADCVRMVDTGYFKRTGYNSNSVQNDDVISGARNSQLHDIFNSADSLEREHAIRKEKRSRLNILQEVLSQTRDLVNEFPQGDILGTDDMK